MGPIQLRELQIIIRKSQIENWVALLVWGAAVVFLWQGLIRHLSVEWKLNPSYGYGWAVPALCGFLVWRDLNRPKPEGCSHGIKLAALFNRRTALAGLILAFGYGPLRLIQEANPDWRLVSWGLALDVLGLTLLLLSWLIQFCHHRNSTGFFPSSLFPFLFFLTAVPWPTFIESRLVEALTRFVTFGTGQALEVLGVPCLVQGNVVEVAAGRISIEEGCSGIRSFQSALMVSLFFGQVYELRLLGRWVCIFAAVSLAVLLNLVRAIVLTMLAAESGAVLVKRWHELAGTPMLVGLFVGVWLVALILRWKRPARAPASLNVEKSWSAGGSASIAAAWVSSLWVPTGLIAWLGVVEVVNKEWYRTNEQNFSSTTAWRVEPPRTNGEFRELPFSADARRFLRFDEGSNTRWLTDDGIVCQAIFLNWKRGGTATHLARSHTPEECLLAGGYELSGKVRILTTCVKGLELTFRGYVAGDGTLPIYVFYCLWEDGVGCRKVEPAWLTYRNRLESVLARRRSAGQRSLEMVLWGAASEEAARNAFEGALNQIVRVSD